MATLAMATAPILNWPSSQTDRVGSVSENGSVLVAFVASVPRIVGFANTFRLRLNR